MTAFRAPGDLAQAAANYCSAKAGNKGGPWQKAADALTIHRGIADAGAMWAADLLNDLQDQAVSAINTATPLGTLFTLPSIDWSNGLVSGGETHHDATKFLAGTGVTMVLPGGGGAQNSRMVEPGVLRLPPGHEGVDLGKLARQLRNHGTSVAGMPPIWVTEIGNGEYMINNGVTRATRAYGNCPGRPKVPITIIDKDTSIDPSQLRRVMDQ